MSGHDSQASPVRPARADPLRAIVLWGRRPSRVGSFLGVLIGLVGHVGLLHAVASIEDPRPTLVAAGHEPERILDVDLVDLPDEAPPVGPATPLETEPEPEPEPAAVEEEARAEAVDRPAADESSADPYDRDVAAAPSEAANVLTSDTDEPVDLTGEGWSMVDGSGSGPIYGYKAKRGTAKGAVFDDRARVGGVPGAAGSGTGTRGTVGVDRSRPAGIVGGRAWSCPFPAAADQGQINSAVAVIVVTVSPEGRPSAVRVLSDPGYGFGPAARQCAYGRTYQPARNAAGDRIRASTPPINVRFRR